MRKKIIMAFCFCLCWAGIVNAQVQTKTWTGTATQAGGEMLSFNKYTGDVADLISVLIKVEFSGYTTRLQLDNDTDVAVTSTASFSNTATATALAGDVNSTSRIVSVGYTLEGNDETLAETQGFDVGGVDYKDFAAQNFAQNKEITSGNKSSYVGTGTFDISLIVSDVVSDGVTSGTVSKQVGSGQTTTKVTVTYTTVPEPTSFMLFILGGIGFVLRRRRK